MKENKDKLLIYMHKDGNSIHKFAMKDLDSLDDFYYTRMEQNIKFDMTQDVVDPEKDMEKELYKETIMDKTDEGKKVTIKTPLGPDGCSDPFCLKCSPFRCGQIFNFVDNNGNKRMLMTAAFKKTKELWIYDLDCEAQVNYLCVKGVDIDL
jgi:hypothetical protein